MLNKIIPSVADALHGIRDDAVVLIGGFGNSGILVELIDALIEQGAKDLTVVTNNAGSGRTDVAKLMAMGRVRKIVCSYPRSAGSVVFEELYRSPTTRLQHGRLGGLFSLPHAEMHTIVLPHSRGKACDEAPFRPFPGKFRKARHRTARRSAPQHRAVAS